MKSIQNKQTSIEVHDGGIPFSAKYSDLIMIALRQNKPIEGYTYDDIENRVFIQRACKEAKETIELEDSYFRYLNNLLSSHKWTFWHEDLIGFRDHITSCQ